MRAAPFVPCFALWLADELMPVWQAVERQAGSLQPPPFWAIAWPGSLALARYLLDHSGVVENRCVLDFGAGGGLAAIAAAQLGAARVRACDIDPLATVVQRMNAALNGVVLDLDTVNPIGVTADVDVVLAGDVCYEREPAERTMAWLRGLVARGVEVLLADPGRHYVPTAGVEELVSYDVPTLYEVESAITRRTRVLRVR